MAKRFAVPVDRLATMSQKDRERYLDKKLAQLVVYACERAPSIRERFEKAGIDPHKVRGIADLQDLPVLRKDALIDLFKSKPPLGGLVTMPLTELERVYVSPGPIYDPHHKSEAFWERHRHLVESVGFGRGDVVINAWSYHMVPAGLMVDEALRRAGATVIPMGVGNTELHVEVMRQLQVTGFFGSTGFFMNIINKAEEMGYDVVRDFKLRLACIGGEMGGGPIRKLVEEKYGITTRDVYGTADVGLFAYECSGKEGMHIAEGVIAEILNPETEKPVSPGDVGEVVVTPIDEVYPLIRFGTGDLAALIAGPCRCGRTSLRITRILGRLGEAVRVRGLFVHPRQLEAAMARLPQVARFQAVVTRPGHRDELVLKVELKGETVPDGGLAEEIREAVGSVITVKVDRVEFVSPGVIPEGGKLIVDGRTY